MKNTLKLTAMIALMFATTVNMAKEVKVSNTFSNEVVDPIEDSKPVLRQKKDMVFLNLLNLGLGAVEITVYDSYGRELFSESTSGKLVVQKAFNFKKAYSGNYTVKVKDADRTYYEEVVVK